MSRSGPYGRPGELANSLNIRKTTSGRDKDGSTIYFTLNSEIQVFEKPLHIIGVISVSENEIVLVDDSFTVYSHDIRTEKTEILKKSPNGEQNDVNGVIYKHGFLASCCMEGIAVFNIDTRRFRIFPAKYPTPIHAIDINMLASSPSLVVGQKHEVKVYDLRSGGRVGQSRLECNCVKIHPSGSKFLVVSVDGLFSICTISPAGITETEIGRTNHSSTTITSCDWRQDGRTFVICSLYSIEMWSFPDVNLLWCKNNGVASLSRFVPYSNIVLDVTAKAIVIYSGTVRNNKKNYNRQIVNKTKEENFTFSEIGNELIIASTQTIKIWKRVTVPPLIELCIAYIQERMSVEEVNGKLPESILTRIFSDQLKPINKSKDEKGCIIQ